MMFITVTGFKTETRREEFHRAMAEVVRDYADWDHNEVERELFDQAERDLESGQDIVYEVSGQHTFDGNPVAFGFDEDDFEVRNR